MCLLFLCKEKCCWNSIPPAPCSLCDWPFLLSLRRGKQTPGINSSLDSMHQFYQFLSYRNLADMDSDGKMDRLEFSIAMKLIKLTLQGRNLPSSLPVTMKQPPTLNSSSNMSSSARFGNILESCTVSEFHLDYL